MSDRADKMPRGCLICSFYDVSEGVSWGELGRALWGGRGGIVGVEVALLRGR